LREGRLPVRTRVHIYERSPPRHTAGHVSERTRQHPRAPESTLRKFVCPRSTSSFELWSRRSGVRVPSLTLKKRVQGSAFRAGPCDLLLLYGPPGQAGARDPSGR
jgi:hypothetical protein